MDRNYDVMIYIQSSFILRMPRVAIFAGLIKIVTMFIKTIFKGSRYVKRVRNYVPETESISEFYDIAKFANLLLKNANACRTQEVCHVIYIFCGSCLGKE